MLFNDTYKTVDAPSEGIFRDKGSKFIGYVFPLRTENDVKSVVENLRQQHPKARHFCWAWRLSQDRNIFRINDDGEPSGTAGRPILNTLLSADITNVLVVVVRYFGGTLLGVPGLINAYKTATLEALKENKIATKTIKDLYQITFNYELMNGVMKIIKDEKLTPINQDFSSICKLQLEIRKSDLNIVLGKFDKLEKVKLDYLSTL